MKLSANTKLSLIIINYNNASLIDRCLASIANQDTKIPYELIIIDDGSTDSSIDVVNLAVLKYKLHPAIIRHKKNHGIWNARLKGVQSSQAEYIAFLDSTNELKPNYFTTIEAEINQSENDLIQINIEQINDNEKSYRSVINCPLVIGVPVSLSTNMFRFIIKRSLFDKVITSESIKLLQQKEILFYEDILFIGLINLHDYKRTYLNTDICYINHRRKSEDNSKDKQRDNKKQLDDFYFVFEYLILSWQDSDKYKNITEDEKQTINYNFLVAIYYEYCLHSKFWLYKTYTEKENIDQLKRLFKLLKPLPSTYRWLRYKDNYIGAIKDVDPKNYRRYRRAKIGLSAFYRNPILALNSVKYIKKIAIIKNMRVKQTKSNVN